MAGKSIHAEGPWQRRLLYGLANWALLLAGLANLAVGTWAAVHFSATVAATSLVAGLALLFAATIDRFETLKGLGIEAKTRQLDLKIVQAEDALRRLRELTELTGAALVDLSSKIGRFDSAPGPQQLIALATRVREIMTALGSDSHVIADALRPWARVLCFDLALHLVQPLKRELQARIQDLEKKRQGIRQPIAPGDPEFFRLTGEIQEASAFMGKLRRLHELGLDDYPERLLALFDGVPLLEPAKVASFRDAAAHFAGEMEVLRRTLQLRNPEAWIAALEEARRREG